MIKRPAVDDDDGCVVFIGNDDVFVMFFATSLFRFWFYQRFHFGFLDASENVLLRAVGAKLNR